MIETLRLPLACVAASLALAACAPSTLPPPDGSPNATSPTTGGPLSGTPEPDALDDASDNATPTSGDVRYECSTGETIVARYPDVETAVIDYKGDEHTLSLAMSADGARYVGDDYEWWTRGTGRNGQATLSERNDDNTTGRQIASCRERS
ncbi:MliC family protein [Salinisphaera sp. Q1T1-3]|uniref:MliC family protein n=1 Tax=Salinisphaera sp. Q1T1-3 TaxID=2321229 RepID=UPI000E75CA71|nr:MliC family protein [Salinisphaera sp. Q1T1-3]RJS91029.1 hypothetical protein D3260_16740 [Salinisphaera sp. Q1T1-3]